MAKDSAALIELGRSFHQVGTVNEKVSERDFVPLWDGTVMRRSLLERKLLQYIPLFKSLGSGNLFYLIFFINTFIQQECVKLIKRDSKDLYC